MFKEGAPKNNQLFIRVAFFIGFLLFFLLVFGLMKELVNRRQVDRQLSDYQKRIDNLKMDNIILAEKIDSWDQSGELEANARIKLGLEKPGEKTVIIDRADSGNTLAVKSNQETVDLASDREKPRYESNYIKWWRYFFAKI
jgi:cell division protein FtsB